MTAIPEPFFFIAVSAANMKRVTGNCVCHHSPLTLVPHADFGLETPLDAWECLAYDKDPEILAIQAEHKKIWDQHPVSWDLKTQEERDQMNRLHEQSKAVREKCEASWIFTVPMEEDHERRAIEPSF